MRFFSPRIPFRNWCKKKCQVTCNQGRINATARPESKHFPAFLSLLAQTESGNKKLAVQRTRRTRTPNPHWSPQMEQWQTLPRCFMKSGQITSNSKYAARCLPIRAHTTKCLSTGNTPGTTRGIRIWPSAVQAVIVLSHPSLGSLPQIPPVSHQGHCDLISSYLSSSA